VQMFTGGFRRQMRGIGITGRPGRRKAIGAGHPALTNRKNERLWKAKNMT